MKGLLLFIMLASAVHAVPHIAGLTDSNGQTVITGSGFGPWNNSNILAWDDMDDYSANTEIPAKPKIGSWHRFSQTENSWTIAALISDEYSISGDNSMWGHRGQKDWSGASVYFDDLDDLYVSFWFRFNHQGVGQVKLMQVKGNMLGTCADYHPSVSTGDVSAGWWKSYIALDEPSGQYGCQYTDPYDSDYSFTPADNTWHFFEAILTQSSPGISDGRVEIRLNGKTQYLVEPAMTRVRPASRWELVQTLNGMTNYDSSNTWIDDYYVAKSFSRVMICDAETYQSAAECAMQIPSSWSDGEVVFAPRTLNTSSYVYVIDWQGTASNGWPLAGSCISLSMLHARILDWMDSRLTLAALMDSIKEWKEGCI